MRHPVFISFLLQVTVMLPWFGAPHPVLEGLGEANLVVGEGEEDLAAGIAAHVPQLRCQTVDFGHDGGEVGAVDVHLRNGGWEQG